MTYAALSSADRPRRGMSKAVFVYEDLRAAIIGLTLKPGASIDKNEICERLGVSRQPLAEAIARLAEERLLEVEPQKGTFRRAHPPGRRRRGRVRAAGARGRDRPGDRRRDGRGDAEPARSHPRLPGGRRAGKGRRGVLRPRHALPHDALRPAGACRRIAETVEIVAAPSSSGRAACSCRRRAATRTRLREHRAVFAAPRGRATRPKPPGRWASTSTK